MEFVIVIYPESRVVIIDGKHDPDIPAHTNKTLTVGPDTHTFRLQGDPDYTPLVREIFVENTDPDDPMKIVFTPIANGGQSDNV